MIYLEKESDDYLRWEYEETLEYYLKTRKNYDKPKLEIEKSKDEPNLNYADLDYYLEPVGVG